MDGIILSFQLFSRIPIKREVEFSKKNLRIALYFLPFVGGIIGAFTGLVMYLLRFYSPFISASFGLLAYFLISGGLHLDGLSDMADGFMANAPKERTLEIMSDSLIGSFGTITLILYFIIKFSCYTAITMDVILTLALTSFISRISVLQTIKRGKLARPGGFGAKMKEALEGEIFSSILLIVSAIGLFIFIKKSLFAFVIAQIIGIIVEYTANKRIGGLTGDIYGAIIEISELGILLAWGRGLWI